MELLLNAQIALLICFITINIKLLFLHDFPRPIETAHDNVQALEPLRATFCNQAWS